MLKWSTDRSLRMGTYLSARRDCVSDIILFLYLTNNSVHFNWLFRILSIVANYNH